MKWSLPPLTPAYRRLQKQVTALHWVCTGSIQRRQQLGTRKLRHPIYQWTRKVRGKTVTVGLTQDQYELLAMAIANQRRLTRLLSAMQKLTIAVLFDGKQ